MGKRVIFEKFDHAPILELAIQCEAAPSPALLKQMDDLFHDYGYPLQPEVNRRGPKRKYFTGYTLADGTVLGKRAGRRAAGSAERLFETEKGIGAASRNRLELVLNPVAIIPRHLEAQYLMYWCRLTDSDYFAKKGWRNGCQRLSVPLHETLTPASHAAEDMISGFMRWIILCIVGGSGLKESVDDEVARFNDVGGYGPGTFEILASALHARSAFWSRFAATAREYPNNVRY